MAIDLYEPRTMLTALRQAPRAQTFIRDLFFANREAVETDHVDIDIVKGNRKMAPFVGRTKSGSVMAREGYTTNSYKPADVKPKIPASDVDWSKRLPGEMVYNGASPAERAAKLYLDDLVFLDETIVRREEWMCTRAITEGKIRQKGDGVDETVEFPLTITTLEAADKFTAETAKALTYFRNVRSEIIKACGIAPNTAVFGKTALEGFLGNKEVNERSDKEKILLTDIEPQLPVATLNTQGVIYWGYLKDSGLYVYSYDEWYFDEDDGEEKPMIDDNLVILGNPAAKTRFMFGAYTEADKRSGSVITHIGDRVARSWVEDDPSIRWVQMVSRPLPVPHQIDAFRALKVV